MIPKNNTTLKHLEKVQKELAGKLKIEDDFSGIQTIGGVDQAFFRKKIISGMIVCKYERLETVEKKNSVKQLKFPYKPGFLFFREGPAIIEAWKKLRKRSEILLVDSHGLQHPRGIGMASHLGVVLNQPTIGVAKRGLVGDYEEPKKVGDYSKITYGGKDIGFILKSKRGCNPIFISPGHKISLKSSLEVVKKCLKSHKLPEPLYKAHQYANEIKTKFSSNNPNI